MVSSVTELSLAVLAAFAFPATSVTAPAATERRTVPSLANPLMATSKVLLSELGFVTVRIAPASPPAVPASETDAEPKPTTASVKATAK